MAMPYKCSLAAPETINVFTDGSWLLPLTQFLGLGGAGVWWPARQLQKRPLSHAELDLAMLSRKMVASASSLKSVDIMGAPPEPNLELESLPLLVMDPSVHIGSDSNVFVDKANKVIQCIAEGKTWAKPWKLESDGDL